MYLSVCSVCACRWEIDGVVTVEKIHALQDCEVLRSAKGSLGLRNP